MAEQKVGLMRWSVARFTYGRNGPPLCHVAMAHEVPMPTGLPTVVLETEALCGEPIAPMYRRLTLWTRLDHPIVRRDVLCVRCRIRAIILGLAKEEVTELSA